MVYCGEQIKMSAQGKNKDGKSMGSHSVATVRTSISFPSDIYKTLEGIARQKKVSLAWVVREAAEQYVADKWPLFKGKV
jgi:predicted DNA-binding ribbon-helix-helix protein